MSDQGTPAEGAAPRLQTAVRGFGVLLTFLSISLFDTPALAAPVGVFGLAFVFRPALVVDGLSLLGALFGA